MKTNWLGKLAFLLALAKLYIDTRTKMFACELLQKILRVSFILFILFFLLFFFFSCARHARAEVT